MNEYDWICRKRNLRKVDKTISERKKQEILLIYNIVVNDNDICLKPLVFDSHQAKICICKSKNLILCDTHFLDIATLMAASFYTIPTYDIERVANMIIADSLICSDDLVPALEYSHKFMGGLHITYMNAICDDEYRRILLNSRTLQTFFVLSHEYAHYRYHKNNSKEDLMIELCNSIFESDLNNRLIKIQSMFSGMNFDLNLLKEESVCDILAFLELLNIRTETNSRIESLFVAIDSFVLSLMTQKMISAAMSFQNKSSVKKIDYVDVRKEILLELIPIIFLTFSQIYEDNYILDNYDQLINRLNLALKKSEIMYSSFQKYIDSIDTNSIIDMYVPFNNNQWNVIYNEISSLLFLPL